jgi:hypothetical protein
VNSASWIRCAATALCAASVVGCANKPAELYMWETFPRHQYKSLLRDSADSEDQIRLMEAQAEKALRSGAALPPGFRAHLGMLYLNAGDSGQAKQMWQAEKVAFPESAPYMDKLLGRLSGAASGQKAAASRSPA